MWEMSFSQQFICSKNGLGAVLEGELADWEGLGFTNSEITSGLLEKL